MWNYNPNIGRCEANYMARISLQEYVFESEFRCKMNCVECMTVTDSNERNDMLDHLSSDDVDRLCRIGYTNEMNYWLYDHPTLGYFSTCVGAFHEAGGNPGTDCTPGVVCGGNDGVEVGVIKLQATLLAEALARPDLNYTHPLCGEYERIMNIWLRPELRITEAPSFVPSISPSEFNLIENGRFLQQSTIGWEKAPNSAPALPTAVTDYVGEAYPVSPPYVMKIGDRTKSFHGTRYRFQMQNGNLRLSMYILQTNTDNPKTSRTVSVRVHYEIDLSSAPIKHTLFTLSLPADTWESVEIDTIDPTSWPEVEVKNDGSYNIAQISLYLGGDEESDAYDDDTVIYVDDIFLLPF